MMPLVRVARPLLVRSRRQKHLRVPHARSDAYTVAMAAVNMGTALAPHQKLLTSAGFTKDVMQDFRHRARELALATKSSRSARERRSAVTAKLAVEFKKAMNTLAVIEGMVMRYAHASGRRMDFWKNSRRVSKRIGQPKRRRSVPAALPDRMSDA